MANAEITSESIRLASLEREVTQLKNKIQNLKMDLVLLHYPIGGQPTPKDAKERIAEGMTKLNELRIEWEKLFEINQPLVEVVDFVKTPTMIGLLNLLFFNVQKMFYITKHKDLFYYIH